MLEWKTPQVGEPVSLGPYPHLRRLSLSRLPDTTPTAELIAEHRRLGGEWDALRASLDECGGRSGSPGEWLIERMGEIETTLSRRGVTIPAE